MYFVKGKIISIVLMEFLYILGIKKGTMMLSIHSFFISMLLWHLTWGWAQVVIDTCIMTCLFKLIVRIPLLKSFFISVVSHICVSGLFLMSTIGIFVYMLGYEFQENDNLSYLTIYKTPFRCACTFGILYALLQAIFFMLLHSYYPFNNIRRVLFIVAISTCISSYLVVSWYMRMG